MLDAIGTIILIGMMLIPFLNLLVGAIVGAGVGGIFGGVLGVGLAVVITALEKLIGDWRLQQIQSRPTESMIADIEAGNFWS